MTAEASAEIQTGEWMSRDETETFERGASLGERLTGGEIILLNGPLGAGKTVFVKGVAHALGYDVDEVTSPSFTLVNIYDARLRVYHIDLYRLNEGASAAHAVDLDELLGDERAVIVIEWAERMGRYPLPSPVYNIEITGDGEEPRKIVVSRQ